MKLYKKVMRDPSLLQLVQKLIPEGLDSSIKSKELESSPKSKDTSSTENTQHHAQSEIVKLSDETVSTLIISDLDIKSVLEQFVATQQQTLNLYNTRIMSDKTSTISSVFWDRRRVMRAIENMGSLDEFLLDIESMENIAVDDSSRAEVLVYLFETLNSKNYEKFNVGIRFVDSSRLTAKGEDFIESFFMEFSQTRTELLSTVRSIGHDYKTHLNYCKLELEVTSALFLKMLPIDSYRNKS